MKFDYSSSSLEAAPEVVACELGSGAALLDLRSGTYYTLNPVASFCWSKLAQPITMERLCEAVQSEFDVDAAACRRDTIALTDELQSAGLLHVDNGRSE